MYFITNRQKEDDVLLTCFAMRMRISELISSYMYILAESRRPLSKDLKDILLNPVNIFCYSITNCLLYLFKSCQIFKCLII